MKLLFLFLIITPILTQFGDLASAAASGASSMSSGGGDAEDIKSPNKESLEGHDDKEYYTVSDIPTIEMPNFESKKKVARDNWSNLFFQDMPVQDEQLEAMNTGYPNSYVQNSPLVYPNAYATGMYPPII